MLFTNIVFKPFPIIGIVTHRRKELGFVFAELCSAFKHNHAAARINTGIFGVRQLF